MGYSRERLAYTYTPIFTILYKEYHNHFIAVSLVAQSIFYRNRETYFSSSLRNSKIEIEKFERSLLPFIIKNYLTALTSLNCSCFLPNILLTKQKCVQQLNVDLPETEREKEWLNK